MGKYWEHFKTITKHKWYVSKACFKCGLVLQGIMHDLSKYSFTEFSASARYFQGDRSPVEAEKDEAGYSIAWQNHKGKNRHHWQYWTDFDKDGNLVCLEMPKKYIAEMICDWVGAGKAYNKGTWSISSLWLWYRDNKDKIVVHPTTRNIIEQVFIVSNSEQKLYDNIKEMLEAS